MKIIFEKETDEDFLEIILTETEARDIICHDVIAKDFPKRDKKEPKFKHMCEDSRCH